MNSKYSQQLNISEIMTYLFKKKRCCHKHILQHTDHQNTINTQLHIWACVNKKPLLLGLEQLEKYNRDELSFFERNEEENLNVFLKVNGYFTNIGTNTVQYGFSHKAPSHAFKEGLILLKGWFSLEPSKILPMFDEPSGLFAVGSLCL